MTIPVGNEKGPPDMAGLSASAKRKDQFFA
jgi:hypothetical protein